MSDFTPFYKTIVRILAHDVAFDWSMPFQRAKANKSTGSGFFVDKKGHILTCAHVVANAAHVFVEVPTEGDRKYTAVVLGICPFFDLAVLRVEGYKNKEYCRLDTGRIKIAPGMETFALGYPMGMTHLKVSKGIISGQQYNFYQTDTAINPGNSGGPLVYRGKVIGVNAAGIAAWAADGIGYAVPIVRYHTVREQLMRSVKHIVHYPQFFGFEDFQVTSQDFQKYLGNKCDSGGVYIKKVLPGSPVSRTALKRTNVVCSVNGLAVDYYGKLRKKWMNVQMSMDNMLAEIGIDNPVKIRYWNGAKMCEEGFKLTTYAPHVRIMYPAFEDVPFDVFGGLVVMNLCVNIIMTLDRADLIEYMKPKNVMCKRLIVANILVGSYLSTLDILKPGDIITTVNDAKVHSVQEFRKRIVKPIDGQYVKIGTEDGKLVVLPVQRILEDEAHLIREFMYTESSSVQKLRKTSGIKISSETPKGRRKTSTGGHYEPPHVTL